MSDQLRMEMHTPHKAYDFLFAGELPFHPIADPTAIGVAGIARVTHRSGGRRPGLLQHLESVPVVIERHLADYEHAVEDTASQQFVKHMVTTIFTQWEISRDRNAEVPLLIASHPEPRELVVTTAQAVESSSQNVEPLTLAKKGDRDLIVKLLTSWGPKFIEQLFDGTTLREWGNHRDMSSDELERWQSNVTPHFLKWLADRHIHDPIRTLDTIRSQMTTALSDEAVAEAYKAPVENATGQLSFRARLEILMHNLTDPSRALQARANARDIEAFCEALAAQNSMGLNADRLRSVLTPHNAAYFAAHYPNDPVGAAAKWLAGDLSVSERKDEVKDFRLTRLKRQQEPAL